MSHLTGRSDAGRSHRVPLSAFRVVWLMILLLVVPSAITLRSVIKPGRLILDAADPSPLGYTRSLTLFLVPLAALGWWFARRRDLILARRSFMYTMAVLAPLGFGLDLLFGNTFFTFPNHHATLGISVPAVGGPLPVEEFVFYLAGFMLVLLCYIWADEYWVARYNIPDYRSQANDLRRIVQFHAPSVVVGIALLIAAAIYKKLFSPVAEGFPWYLAYLIAASFIPSAGFFRTAQPFVNWRAFSFAFFPMLLISLLWEATLAIPYGWWNYRMNAMVGLTVGAWHGLPLEAVCVWLAVTYTTVIVYEVIKIWQALGTTAWKAFFGGSPDSITPS